MDKMLVGAWRLQAWEFTATDGSVVKPLGEAPNGSAIFTADGHASVNLSHEQRPRFADEAIFAGTDEEWTAAARSYISFMGPYRIEGGTIIFDVVISLFPNWVGQDIERLYEIDGDQLILSTPTPIPVGGVERTGTARLERIH